MIVRSSTVTKEKDARIARLEEEVRRINLGLDLLDAGDIYEDVASCGCCDNTSRGWVVHEVGNFRAIREAIDAALEARGDRRLVDPSSFSQ